MRATPSYMDSLQKQADQPPVTVDLVTVGFRLFAECGTCQVLAGDVSRRNPAESRGVEGGPGIAEDLVDKSYAVRSSRNRLDTNMLKMLKECRRAWLLLWPNFPAST